MKIKLVPGIVTISACCFFGAFSVPRICRADIDAHGLILYDLLPQFQPLAYSTDPSDLQRTEVVPDAVHYPNPPWPIAIVGHAGGFHGGGPKSSDLNPVYTDLSKAGFLVFGVTYRLAPPGLIPNQPSHTVDPTSGRPPEQSNDMKQQVLAARFDQRCNGTVVVVGGSAGGSHGVWVAIDIASEGGLSWVDLNRVNATASLSGAYDYSRIDPGDPNNGDPDVVRQFADAVLNYTNLTRNDITQLYSLSPVALITNNNVKPMILICTSDDSMPVPQRTFMTQTLDAHSVTNYSSFQLSDTLGLHAFEYWRTIDPVTNVTIGQDVINFLNANIPPH